MNIPAAVTTKALAGEKFTDDEVTVELAVAALSYLQEYTGAFNYLCDLKMRKRISIGQTRGILNCWVADAKRTFTASTPEPLVSLPRIAEVFANATGISYPKVRLQTASGFEIVLKVLGNMSKMPGAISIVSREKLDFDPAYGDKQRWYGTIALDGSLRRGKALTTDIMAALADLNADPTSAASAYGKATGFCCFCGKFIETKESMAVGYGPVCADNYGLPWGQADEDTMNRIVREGEIAADKFACAGAA